MKQFLMSFDWNQWIIAFCVAGLLVGATFSLYLLVDALLKEGKEDGHACEQLYRERLAAEKARKTKYVKNNWTPLEQVDPEWAEACFRAEKYRSEHHASLNFCEACGSTIRGDCFYCDSCFAKITS